MASNPVRRKYEICYVQHCKIGPEHPKFATHPGQRDIHLLVRNTRDTRSKAMAKKIRAISTIMRASDFQKLTGLRLKIEHF